MPTVTEFDDTWASGPYAPGASFVTLSQKEVDGTPPEPPVPPVKRTARFTNVTRLGSRGAIVWN